MVDQPSAGASRSYKIRGHTRQRRTTKPYARPSEVKKKGLLDTVKDYLSPSWLFSYFQKDEAEESSDSEEEMNEDEEDPRLNDKRSSPEYNVTRIENSTETPPIIEDNNSIFEHEDKTRNIVSPPSQLAQEDSRVSDKDDFRSSVFSENNNKGERWIHSGMSSRLSGELEDDEDEVDILQTSKHITETEQPQHSVLSYSSQQLKRRPLPSILHSRTPTSTLFQHRNTPMIRSQGNSLLSLMATTINTTSFSSQPSNVVSSRTNTRTTAASSSTTTSSDPWKRSQPVAPISSAPGFSVSTFVTPVPRVFTKRRTESPFYPGTVTYGGALSQSGYTSKRQRRNSPSSEICQPVRKQQIRAKPLPNAVHGGATSQTAQRILEALESVSSPLKDVRRIPSPLPSLTASPLSFSPTKLRTKPPRSKVGPRVSSLQAKLLGGPPVEVLSAPQNAKVSSINVSEAYHPKTMSTPLPPSDNPLTRQTADRSVTLFSGLKDTVLKTSLPTFFTPKSLPTSLSPVEKTTKASGKMRSASRGVSHYSAKNNEDDYQAVNPLPEIVHAVPLPVNPSKNMSSLFKSSQVDHSKSFLKKAENNNKPLENHPAIMEKFVSESSKNGFVFSKPKQHIVSVKEALSMADDEVSFSFSQPVSVKTMAKKDIKADSAKDLSKMSPLASEKCSNDVKTLEVHSGTNLSETRSSLANMFGSAPGEWDCLMCMIQNKASVDICVACSSARPNKKKTEESEKKSKEEPSKASSSDLAKQFAPVEGSWDCETCLVNNKASELTCVACSTAKPGATESGSRDQRSLGVDLKAKFAAPANTWDCEVCMIRNTIEHDKCVACETNRPGSTTTDENELKSKFAAPPGSWSCEMCMIRNTSSDVKCVACETAKPGSDSNTGFGQSVFNLVSSSSNGNTKSSSSSSGFTFGNNAVTTSTVPSFTFGKSTSEETKPSFTFGNSSATTETPKSEFKFGVNSTSEQKTVPKFTFGLGLPQNNKPETGFGFGAKGSDTKSSLVTTDQNKAVSNINSVKTAGSGPLNIAQAAAAGLLKVPGLNDITPSSKQAATSQPAFQLQVSNSLPLFTNGSTSFGAPPKNVPDSSTVAAPPKENTPALATTSSTSVKITPFSFGGVVPAPASVSSSTTTVPEQTPLGNAVGNQIGNLPVSKPQASFNFSAQSSNKKNNGKPSFSFGDSTTASKDSSGATFKFGATTEVQSNAVTKTSSLFPTTASGSTVTPTATAGMFSFTGSGGSTVDKPKTPQFNFGAMNGPSSSTGTSTTQSQNTGNALFNFSAGQPSNPDNENQNSLGGEEMDADSNNNNDNGQSSFAPAAPAGFNFTPGGFSFGTGGATTMPSNFQFGTPSSTTNNNNNTPSGGFNFVPSAAVPAGSSPFVFGGQSTAAASVPANVPSASSGGFNFGAPAANTPTPSFNFGQAPTGAPQPAAFNIGAAQNTPASARVIKRGIRRTRR